MRFLNIRKNGIDNVVDEAQYDAIYKPAGWKIVGEEETAQEKTSPFDEIEKKNLNKTKRQKPKKFDDHLLKGADDGEV